MIGNVGHDVRMDRHEFLARLHEAYRPRNYLEIGINDGRGLAVSRTRTIGVDPAFRITSELACDLRLVKQTSDDFFAGADPLSWFAEGVADLTFIDGMHLAEFALRDFINAERCSTPASVIVLDDMLPRLVVEANRDRTTNDWTGDVYKVADALTTHRPDLVVLPVDTAPTGVVVVVGVDPGNRVLAERCDELIGAFVRDDPQDVPTDVLSRRYAAAPEPVLDSPVWAALAAARDNGASLPDLAGLRELRGSARYVADPPEPKPWPPRPAARPRPRARKRAPAPTGLRRVRAALARRLAP